MAIDTHAHLFDEAFDSDRLDVINRIIEILRSYGSEGHMTGNENLERLFHHLHDYAYGDAFINYFKNKYEKR